MSDKLPALLWESFTDLHRFRLKLTEIEEAYTLSGDSRGLKTTRKLIEMSNEMGAIFAGGFGAKEEKGKAIHERNSCMIPGPLTKRI